jgi:KDO2-lipid IV(A) lauroyltransferase
MFAYILFRFVVFVFWLMPFWLMYGLSNGLYYILYYVVRYRRKVVHSNLLTAFGDLSEAERKVIEKKFYRHLCDISLEGIKGVSMSAQELKRRYKIINAEKIQEYAAKKQSVLLIGSHIGNWEWGAVGAPMQIDHKVVIIYKAIGNKYIDNYVRGKHSAQFSEMRTTQETRLAFAENAQNTCVFILIGDQNPSNRKEAHWVDFFGKPTATLHGIAKYAQEYNLPLVFFHTARRKRGFYEVWEEVLITDPNALAAEEISRIFMQKVEAAIRRSPSDWLWSHKRWKYTQDEI